MKIRMAFVDVVYVQVSKNSMLVRNITRKMEVIATPDAPFTTARLLIGEFERAETALTKTIKHLHKGIFPPSPVVIIHPLEMIEGGLSEVEKRTLLDVADGAGASISTVWVGKKLSDEEAQKMAEDAV